MPIDRLDIDNLKESDLAELLNAQLPEGLYVEYKKEVYGNTNEEKRELLKDVSSFANVHGGHLIIGMDEQGGLPIAIDGVASTDPDQDILRLEQLIRDGIEPRITGIRTLHIRLGSGNYCFVIRIPSSWNPPHRVRLQNANRFYIRNSSGAHEASMDELRELFTLGLTVTERARAFQRDRVDALARGLRVGGHPLHSGGRLILHIIPLSAFASSLHIDLELVSSHRNHFPPIHSGAWTSRFNFDGFISHSGGEVNHGYTQVFRNGILEATQSSIIREKNEYRYIPGPIIEHYIRSVLSTFIKGLNLVGVPVPLIIMLAFEGVEGVCYDPTGNMYYGSPPPLDQNTLYLPEGMVTEYGEEISYHRAVRPAIDALWNAAGQVRAESFDPEGRWLSR